MFSAYREQRRAKECLSLRSIEDMSQMNTATALLRARMARSGLRQPTRTEERQGSPEAIQSVEDVSPGYKYDVFLSFRGPDTRRNFADCLYNRLECDGVHVFRDYEELRIGEEIGERIFEELDKSQICIPIFSENYASSSWCLREVARMVEGPSKSERKREILPIFYDVDTDVVKLKSGSYKTDIPKHEEKFGSDELKRWEAALVKVAHMKGWEREGRGDGELSELVVKEVLPKLHARNRDLPEHYIEDQRQVLCILEKLKVDPVDRDGVRFLGIHGTGGIGKTVLAKVVFNRVSSQFQSVCFLKDVRESSQGGLVEVQKKLLSSIGGSVNKIIKDDEEGKHWIEKKCHDKRVLIVLDDLDKEEQLQKLAGKSNWFGPGSRIIFTTRNLEILKTQVKSSSEEKILDYEVDKMEFGPALQLLCKHAFGTVSPRGGYDDNAKKIVHRVGMLPLAIEVIGSYLRHHGEMLEVWEETLNRLDRGPFGDRLRNSLMISFEGLENKEEKEVFLDIACLFTNKYKKYPEFMWKDCDYRPYGTLSVLKQRSLIKFERDGGGTRFWMHDQVRDLGRHIVLEKYPYKFSRVWIYKDAIKLLEKKQRNEDVQALSLTSDGCSRHIAPEELAALPNLRFMRLKGIDFSGNFENLILKLCWLSWEVRHNNIYAENFHFDNLVVLDLSMSNIEDDWGGWSQFQMTKKLKVLDLTCCMRLTRTPDFSKFMSLEILILHGCVKLTMIHPSLGKLDHLKTLNLEYCLSLKELPLEVESMPSLEMIGYKEYRLLADMCVSLTLKDGTEIRLR